MRIVTPLKLWDFAREDGVFQKVSVPHDWAIAGPFDRANDNQFVKIIQDGEQDETEHNGRTGGLPHVGRGTYRCVIQGPADPARRTFLEFGGVMSKAKVYVNGELAGSRNYGYSTFRVNASRLMKPGENRIEVTAENLCDSSRWYPGAGMYRAVRKIETDPVYFDQWGLHVKYLESGRLFVEGDIRNDTGSPQAGKITLRSDLFEENTWEFAVSARSYHFAKSIALKEFRKWDIDDPVLYDITASVETSAGSDTETIRYGIRTLKYDLSGFYLNGRRVSFKGVCLHHDLGPIGAAFNLAAARRQLAIMKQMGCNAIRTSHNPPASELLDLCDEMGLMVLDEAFDAWHTGKLKNDYHLYFDADSDMDISDMVKRDRNHPCVVLWSIGNEIMEQEKPEWNGAAIAKALTAAVKRCDTERPVTVGFNMCYSAYTEKIALEVDIPGWNYHPHLYNKFFNLIPGRPHLGTETLSTLSSRGIYRSFDTEYVYLPGREFADLQCNSYCMDVTPWATTADVEFAALDSLNWMLGQFIWTGFDYLGEPTPYNEQWPARSSYFGCVDLVGLPKDLFFLIQSEWKKDDEPMIHIVPNQWNFEGRDNIPVHVFSNCSEVELFLNGTSLGRTTRANHACNLAERYRFIWNAVPWQPGVLKAVGYRDNKACAEEILRTAGTPAKLVLTTDRACCAADGEDMLFVTVSVTDASGVPCPNATSYVRFKTEGKSLRIAAADGGNAASVEPFPTPECSLFSGKAVVYLRSTGTPGDCVLTAECDGLEPANVELSAK